MFTHSQQQVRVTLIEMNKFEFQLSINLISMRQSNFLAKTALLMFIALLIGTQSFAQFKLTVLHNNDGESKLLNAGTGNLANFGGVSRFKTVLDTLRAQSGAMNIPAIMLASGDNTLAGPDFFLSQQLPYGTPFYDVVAMNSFDYDAICIGNHDFDFGPDLLARIIRDFNPLPQAPWLCANANFSAEDSLQILVNSGRIAPNTVLNINGTLVGVVGAITPRLPYISSPRGVVIDTNVANVVQSQVDNLTSNGVKIIILISHLQSIKEDSILCRRLTGVDVMVGGGGSEVLANSGDLLVPGDVVYGSYPYYVPNANSINTPLITTEGAYKYVGRMICEFDNMGNLTSIDTASGPVRVAGGANPDSVTRNAQLVNDVDVPVQAGLAGLAQNIIAQSNVALDGRRTQVRTQETNLGDVIADAFLWKATMLAPQFGQPIPDIALQNGGGIRNNSIIQPGNLSELTTFSVLPFANFLCIVPNVPRTQVKEILENAISNFAQVDGRFAQVAGLQVEYNLQGQRQIVDNSGNVITPGTRVRNAYITNGNNGIGIPIVQNGNVVPGPALNIATIDFLANGGDQYPFRGIPFGVLGVSYQGAFADYLENGLNGVVSSAQYPQQGLGRITIADIPLPVELASFTSFVNGNNVTLNWATSSELNNMAFDIERSVSGSGDWTKTGTVAGSGTTNELRNYTFEDKALASGRYEYRLKQVDYNGNFEYHNLSGEVVIGVPAEFSLAQNYPNPFNPSTKINFDIPTNSLVTLKVYDVAGNEVMSLVNEQKNAGSYSINFTGSNLSSGVYIYRLQAGEFSAVKKMTLIK
jgi:5'-nucleotidase/UDP-sugar diphosphatase